MRAELRRLLTIEGDFLEEVREREGAFCVWLRAHVGASGSQGEDYFDFGVCSPAWLEAEVERQRMIAGRLLLIVREFRPKEIEAYVREQVSRASGDDWPTVAAKIGRWSHWEFEDFRES